MVKPVDETVCVKCGMCYRHPPTISNKAITEMKDVVTVSEPRVRTMKALQCIGFCGEWETQAERKLREERQHREARIKEFTEWWQSYKQACEHYSRMGRRPPDPKRHYLNWRLQRETWDNLQDKINEMYKTFYGTSGANSFRNSFRFK